MAKVQGKSAAAASAKKTATKKPKVRSKAVKASSSRKPAKKKASAKPTVKKAPGKKAPVKVPAKVAAKTSKKAAAKSARKPPSKASKKAPAKAAKKPKAKPAGKSAGKPAKKAPKSGKPVKAASKPAKTVKAAAKTVAKAAVKGAKQAKPVAKVVKVAKPSPTPKSLPAPKAPAPKVGIPKATGPKVAGARPALPPKPGVASKVAPALTAGPLSAKGVSDNGDKKRARRPRTRVQSSGTPVAAWLNAAEKPRPSSFIPAPARAEAPSLVAAPPASSDRLIRSEDLAGADVRSVPVRVDIEQGGGKVYIGINPIEALLRVGEGLEWDFRYIGGSDVTVDEIVIEFEQPAPFPQSSFRSRKPGTARPHRQLSGASQSSASGMRISYTIRAMTPFKTELAIAQPWVTVR